MYIKAGRTRRVPATRSGDQTSLSLPSPGFTLMSTTRRRQCGGGSHGRNACAARLFRTPCNPAGTLASGWPDSTSTVVEGASRRAKTRHSRSTHSQLLAYWRSARRVSGFGGAEEAEETHMGSTRGRWAAVCGVMLPAAPATPAPLPTQTRAMVLAEWSSRGWRGLAANERVLPVKWWPSRVRRGEADARGEEGCGVASRTRPCPPRPTEQADGRGVRRGEGGRAGRGYGVGGGERPRCSSDGGALCHSSARGARRRQPTSVSM